MPITSRTTLAIATALSLLAVACTSSSEPAYVLDCETLALSRATATGLRTTASGLQVRDVVVGSGADVVAGSRVQTHYAACTSTGVVFAEVPSPSLFSFTVGAGQVIAGLDEGVQGMKLGGRRQLVIPPALGYGQGGSPGGFVVPYDTLVITVDAVGLR
jgi:FKBP-type peptidyl-prolyl cis-trans isomerase